MLCKCIYKYALKKKHGFMESLMLIVACPNAHIPNE
jgi:hypothetical protein